MLDFAKYAVGGATRPDSFTSMRPEMQSGLFEFLQAADSELGEGLQVYSGYRSPELQAKLYADALEKYGSEAEARKWVAPPGNSKHNSGEAADLKWNGVRIDKLAEDHPVRRWISENVGRFGLAQPLSWEPWQVELASARSGGGASNNQEQSEPVETGGDLAGWAASLLGGGAEAAPDDDPTTAARLLDMIQEPATDPLLQFEDTGGQFLEPSGPTPAQQPRPFFDITADMTKGSRALLSQAGDSITGRGPSIAQQFLPEGAPQGLGRVLDVGLGAAGLASTAFTGGAGVVGDIAEATGVQNPQGLARDLAAMPEAFAASVGGISRVPSQARRAAREAEVPPAATSTEKQFGDVAIQAARGNPSAQADLARRVRVNPEAVAASERLGIDVPLDVLADDEMLRQVSGLLRRVDGTEDAVRWSEALSEASENAQLVLRNASGFGDVSEASARTRVALQDSLDLLRSNARAIYDDTSDKLPPGTRVSPSNSVKAVNDALADRGGVNSLPGPAKRLYDLITNENGVTYTQLKDLKGELWRAKRGQGEYKDASEWMVNTVYQAVSKDMEEFAGAVLGKTDAARIQDANRMWREADTLRGKLEAGFGKDFQGSIASLLTSSLRQGGRGDVKSLNRVLNVVPEDMRGDALISALEELSKTRTGSNPGAFSFRQFARTYEGLRSQSQVYGAIAKELPTETHQMLRDLYEVSARVARTEDQVKNKTGASLQGYFVEGILTRTLDTSAGRVASSMTGGLAANAMAGPIAGAAAQAGVASLRFGGRRAKAAGRLFRSPEFQKMAIEAAREGQVSNSTYRSVRNSSAFKAWGRAVGLDDPNAWLLNAVVSQQITQSSESENAQ